MEREVKVKIVSRVYDLQESDRIEQYMAICPDYSEDDISTKIELSCRGTLSEQDGVLRVCYQEPEREGMGETQTCLSFNKELPDRVSLYRTGDVRSNLVFDVNEGRSTCLYETPFMPLELSIITKKLRNQLSADGGTLPSGL